MDAALSDYCTIEGAAIDSLITEILDAFDAQELNQAIRVEFGVSMYAEYVASDLAGRDLVFELLEAFRRRGTTAIFLRALRRRRPTKPSLISVIQELCPAAMGEPRSAKAEVRTVKTGLEELLARADDPIVKPALQSSSRNLEGLADGFVQLKAYKGLHDCLQVIQLKQYRLLISDLKRLRDDPQASYTLDSQVRELENCSRTARASAELLPDTPRERRMEIKLIVDPLETAVKDLDMAIKNLDDRSAGSSARAIRGLIRMQPVRVNAILTATAEDLPLDSLIAAFQDVRARLGNGNPARANIDNALQSLQNLLPRLRGAVAEHDRWQSIENELWAADQSMEQGPEPQVEEFKANWGRARPLIEVLQSRDPEADWVKNSKKFADEVDVALPADITRARINYGRFRNEALLQFSRVDGVLSALCAEIVELGKPLRDLLKKVPDDN
jgi:hypothetical protein